VLLDEASEILVTVTSLAGDFDQATIEVTFASNRVTKRTLVCSSQETSWRHQAMQRTAPPGTDLADITRPERSPQGHCEDFPLTQIDRCKNEAGDPMPVGLLAKFQI
jgi:hypothetical protein